MTKPQKILVTGGAGYIGSHTVVELLEHDFDVIIVDNFANSEPFILDRIRKITGKSFDFIEHDLTDRAGLEQELSEVTDPGEIGAVVHFAALKSVNESVERPLEYHRNNTGCTLTVMELMKDWEIPRLVFSSSCTVYGQPETLPVKETSPVLPAQSPYGSTKQISEIMVRDMVLCYAGFQAIILRYFNPAGAHSSGLIGELPRGIPNNLVPFITQTAAGLRDELKIFGKDYHTPDGTCIRDFIHVTDLAKAHVAALMKMQQGGNYRPGIFNIGTGKGTSVLEAVKIFEAVTGRSLKYSFAPRRPGDIEQIWADPSLAFAELDWRPQLGMKEAMLSAWNWQKNL